MNLPFHYYDIIEHPMLKEIKETIKVNLNTSIPFYNLSKLIGKEVKHFKRDIVSSEDVFKYVYKIDNFVLDANDPSKIFVIYSTIYPDYIGENKSWARELSEFFSKVDKEKYPSSREEYRFTRLLERDKQMIQKLKKFQLIH